MKNKDSQSNHGLTPSARTLVPPSPSTPLARPISGLPDDAHYDVPHFDPVPVQPRHDGWSPERQRSFIEALAATACVEDSARAVGMSSKSAYLLRARPDAMAFRAAWAAALHFAVATLEAKVFSRAIHGVPVPHYYKGELIGEHRRYNDQMAMFLMRHNDLARYAKGWDSVSPHELDGGAGPRVRATQLFQRMKWLDPDLDDEGAGSDDAGEGERPHDGS